MTHVGMRGVPQTETLFFSSDYHLAYSVRADFYRRMGRFEPAIADYRQALSLVRQEPERRFLEKRITSFVESV